MTRATLSSNQCSIVLLCGTVMLGVFGSAAWEDQYSYATLACRPVCNNDLWHSQCSMFVYDL